MQQLFGNQLQLTGAGRTDSGVHAEMMYAHFDVENKIEDTSKMAEKLNYMMPRDIAVQQLVAVKQDAHARFDAVSRMYEYRMSNIKNPFNRYFTSHYHGRLDIDAMNKAADILFEYSDFTSFSKLHTDVKTNNCKIMKAFWEERGNILVFTIKADRFLRNMVRAIVGTLIDVGKGKIDSDDFRKIIEAKNRCSAGTSVEAKGLFLTEIVYPENIYLQVF